ncbi:Isoleucine--tRNA ligase [Raoultella terrigena]|uniref:Isoleucine--tRNA ligase n=1 Tax=Raoultella terrigena TaxID=577 RepID=A0A4U9DCY9_RAOTE|nr:Isoleucine--tRNA ligase [Raoultella terrigena]
MNDGFWDELLKVRGEVNKVIEQARADKLVGGSLEAAVTLYADSELATKLNALGDELRFVLLTSGRKWPITHRRRLMPGRANC